MVQASHLEPAAITGIAVHGTGTPLGDPIGAHDVSHGWPSLRHLKKVSTYLRGKNCVTNLSWVGRGGRARRRPWRIWAGSAAAHYGVREVCLRPHRGRCRCSACPSTHLSEQWHNFKILLEFIPTWGSLLDSKSLERIWEPLTLESSVMRCATLAINTPDVPAAGLTGVLMATATINHRAATPIAGLRSLNPYVGSTLREWARKELQPLLPRQLSPGSTMWPDLSVGGAWPWHVVLHHPCPWCRFPGLVMWIRQLLGLGRRHQLVWFERRQLPCHPCPTPHQQPEWATCGACALGACALLGRAPDQPAVGSRAHGTWWTGCICVQPQSAASSLPP